jgi:hypothetical protein
LRNSKDSENYQNVALSFSQFINFISINSYIAVSRNHHD